MRKIIGLIPLVDHKAILINDDKSPKIFQFFMEIPDDIKDDSVKIRYYEREFLTGEMLKKYGKVEIGSIEYLCDCQEELSDTEEKINLSVYYGTVWFEEDPGVNLKLFSRTMLDATFMNSLSQGTREALEFLKTSFGIKF